jgi:hypothetical protein
VLVRRGIDSVPLADPVPAPLDPTRLEPVLARLWETARTAQFRDRAVDAALTAYGQLLEGNPAAIDLAWGELIEVVCSNAVWRPSWVSRPLLDAVVSLLACAGPAPGRQVGGALDPTRSSPPAVHRRAASSPVFRPTHPHG